MTNREVYTTCDLNLATYLVVVGLTLKDVHWISDKRQERGKALYLFNQSELIKQKEEDFLFGRTQVEPRNYLSIRKVLLERMIAAEQLYKEENK